MPFFYTLNSLLPQQTPDEITTLPELQPNQVTELSASARSFLLNLAQIAYNECERPLQPDSADGSGSEVEESLTWDALKIVLSVLPADTEDPWSDPPSFKVCLYHLFVLSGFIYHVIFVSSCSSPTCVHLKEVKCFCLASPL